MNHKISVYEFNTLEDENITLFNLVTWQKMMVEFMELDISLVWFVYLRQKLTLKDKGY